MSDSAEAILRDVLTIGRIEAVPMLLRIVSETTGMGFAAVARVTEGTWTACAVHDQIEFNLKPGGQLDVSTTLCKEVRAAGEPVVIDHASLDPVYSNHHTPRTYAIESYVSVPIVLSDGQYFGNLCAIDPRPAKVSNPAVLAMFISFAQLIGMQLEAERHRELEHAALLDERAMSELREQFIAVLGHDLRNPMAAVLANAYLLSKKSNEPDTVLKIAERLIASTQRMSGLIDNTLDLARARLGGGLGITARRLDDLGTALSSVAAELQMAWPERVIDTTVDVRHPVWGDLGRLQQVASNLLGNALTHGAGANPVLFTATTDDSSLTLGVTNQGEPIAPEHLGKIFSPYWRQSAPGQGEGLGLGLYICAQIVKAHGGTLGVSSTAEAGTTFTVRLPLGGPGLA